MREFADLDDADDLKPLIGMVEEALVAQLHLAHEVARLIVADTGPLFAFSTLGLLLLPRPGIRLRLEQPIRHVVLRRPQTSSGPSSMRSLRGMRKGQRQRRGRYRRSPEPSPGFRPRR